MSKYNIVSSGDVIVTLPDTLGKIFTIKNLSDKPIVVIKTKTTR